MANLELIVSEEPKREGRDFPTLEEIRSLKKTIAENYGAKDAFIVDMILSTGLNPCEIICLECADLKKSQLRVRSARKRTVFFSENFYAHFVKYVKTSRPDSFVLTGSHDRMTGRGVKKAVKQFIAKAGINPNYSSRSIRYAYIYHLYQSAGELDVVHAQLGVKNIQFRMINAEPIEVRAHRAAARLYK